MARTEMFFFQFTVKRDQLSRPLLTLSRFELLAVKTEHLFHDTHRIICENYCAILFNFFHPIVTLGGLVDADSFLQT